MVSLTALDRLAPSTQASLAYTKDQKSNFSRQLRHKKDKLYTEILKPIKDRSKGSALLLAGVEGVSTNPGSFTNNLSSLTAGMLLYACNQFAEHYEKTGQQPSVAATIRFLQGFVDGAYTETKVLGIAITAQCVALHQSISQMLAVSFTTAFNPLILLGLIPFAVLNGYWTYQDRINQRAIKAAEDEFIAFTQSLNADTEARWQAALMRAAIELHPDYKPEAPDEQYELPADERVTQQLLKIAEELSLPFTADRIQPMLQQQREKLDQALTPAGELEAKSEVVASDSESKTASSSPLGGTESRIEHPFNIGQILQTQHQKMTATIDDKKQTRTLLEDQRKQCQQTITVLKQKHATRNRIRKIIVDGINDLSTANTVFTFTVLALSALIKVAAVGAICSNPITLGVGLGVACIYAVYRYYNRKESSKAPSTVHSTSQARFWLKSADINQKMAASITNDKLALPV